MSDYESNMMARCEVCCCCRRAAQDTDAVSYGTDVFDGLATAGAQIEVHICGGTTYMAEVVDSAAPWRGGASTKCSSCLIMRKSDSGF